MSLVILYQYQRNPNESIGITPIFPLCQFTKYEYIKIPIRTEISLYNFIFFKNMFETKFYNINLTFFIYNLYNKPNVKNYKKNTIFKCENKMNSIANTKIARDLYYSAKSQNVKFLLEKDFLG